MIASWPGERVEALVAVDGKPRPFALKVKIEGA
jgi:hypothetical protein